MAAEGLAPAIVDGVDVAADGGAPVTIVLEDGAAVTFAAEDAAGEPLPGAAIFLQDARDRYVMTGETEPRTGADGRVVLRLAPGAYRIHVQADGRAPADRAVEIGGDTTVPFRLEPGGEVEVLATDAAGPVPGADVRAFREDGTELLRRFTTEDLYHPPVPAVTGPDGRYVVADLPEGRVRILVRARDGRTGEARVEVTAGGRASVAIALE